MNRRDEEETKIIQNTMDEIDIEDAKRLRLEYNRLCKSGELSHGMKRQLREANAYNILKGKLTMLLGTY